MTEPQSITDAEVEDICGRLHATTPGPWKSYVEGRDHTSGSNFIKTGGADIELSGASVADQDFIAHAHEDVRRLLAEVQRLRALLGATPHHRQ